jgi:hypothetical protein
MPQNKRMELTKRELTLEEVSADGLFFIESRFAAHPRCWAVSRSIEAARCMCRIEQASG